MVAIAAAHDPQCQWPKAKKKRPKGYYSKAQKDKRAEARDLAKRERQKLDEARADHAKAKARIRAADKKRGDLMTASLNRAVDRLDVKLREANERFARERAQEEARKSPPKKKKKREKKDVPDEVEVYVHGHLNTEGVSSRKRRAYGSRIERGTKVKIQTRLDPLAAMYNRDLITASQWHASKLFNKDFEKANYAGLSSKGFDPAVDGGGYDRSNPAVIASLRLMQLKDACGDELYMVLVAVCGYGYTITQLHERGGGQATTIGTKLKEALNKASAFYSGKQQHEPSKLMQVCQRIVQEYEREVEKSPRS